MFQPVVALRDVGQWKPDILGNPVFLKTNPHSPVGFSLQSEPGDLCLSHFSVPPSPALLLLPVAFPRGESEFIAEEVSEDLSGLTHCHLQFLFHQKGR